MTSRQPRLIRLVCISTFIAMFSACGGSTPVRSVTENVEATTSAKIDPVAEQKFKDALDALQTGDTQTAEDIFLELTEAHPKMAAPYANLGMILNQKGETQKAERALKQSLALNKDNPEAYNHLGILYRGNGRFDMALKTYQAGLEKNPDHPNLLLNAGILYDLYLDQPDQALTYYQRYQKISPDDKQIELWISDINHRIVTQE